MRTLSSCRFLLLCLLLPATLFVHAQQRYEDTILLHFALDRFDVQAPDAAKPAGYFRDSLFNPKNIDSVLITGYTDKTGTVAHNQRLSAQRAAAAGDWLQAQLGELRAVTNGHLPPAGDHASSPSNGRDSLRWRLAPGGIAPTPEYSDSANRRAEIVIHYHPDPPVPQPADTVTALQRDSTQPSLVISLEHINFVVDTPVPTDATRHVLPRYVQTLRKYADRRMEIDGFCNSVVPLHGPNDPLFILSVKRARFIYDYLVAAGYDSTRLTYKGMGNASPINSHPVDRQEMDANMRVEIKIF